MAYIFVLNGRDRCRAHRIDQETTVIGKSPDADIIIPDPWVSGTHATIHLRDGAYFIEDLASTNGTFVNCDRLGAHEAPLEEDDLVFLGRTHLLVTVSDRPPSARPRPSASGTHAPPLSVDDVFEDPMRDSEPTLASIPPFFDVGAIDAFDDEGDDVIEEDAFRAPPFLEEDDDDLDLATFDSEDALLVEPRPHREQSSGQQVIIDVADLLDETGAIMAQEDKSVANHKRSPTGELHRQIALRDAEITRLRRQVLTLQEKYLDMEG